MNANSFWSRELPVEAITRSLVKNRFAIAIGAGVLFRLVAYLSDRPYWMDEASLVRCIEDLGQTGLLGPLGSTQLAPPGFLAAEWAVTHLLGTFQAVYRLVPFLAGVASLFLFREVAHRCLSDRGEWVAVVLFAMTDDLIYFASEVKQYSSDLALTLLCLAMAFRVGREPRSARAALGFALLGAGVVWFSHPSIFTLAAIGVVGLARAVGDRNPKRAAVWVGVGLAWLASFALVHLVAMGQLDHRIDMWVFWDFAFPTVPPRSFWDLLWPIRRLAFLFASPLNFDAPFSPGWSIWPAFALMVLGSLRMLRTEPTRLACLFLPGGFALVASYLKLYPFHGRLLLFFAPLLLIPTASGLDGIRGHRLRWFLMAWVLGPLAWSATYHMFDPIQRTENPYGDRRPSTLNPYWFPLEAPLKHPVLRRSAGLP